MKKTRKNSLGFKTTIIIFSMVLIIGVIDGLISHVVFSNTINNEYTLNATHIASMVSATVDVDTVKKLKDKVSATFDSLDNKVNSDHLGTDEFKEYITNFSDILSDEDYIALCKDLDIVRTTNEVESVYILYIDPKEVATVYIADGSTDPCLPGTFDPLYENNQANLTDPTYGFPAYITNTKGYGWLVTAGTPIYDHDGEVIAYCLVDKSMNEIKSVEYSFTGLLLAVTIIIAILVGILYIHLTRKAVINPINALSKAALSYTQSEERNVFSQIDISTGDEIENLSDAMKQMEKDIENYINNITSITAEKERIGAELNVATQIQMDMLPSIFPSFPDKHEFELYASMDPAKEVGGDFYDFFLIDEEHLGLVVADVSGKGVPAALFMVIAKTLIKNRALIGGTPSEILSYANEQLCEGNEAELFVTVWFAILNIKTGKGIAANAGHEHPALRRAGGEYELVMYKHSPAVATMEGLKFREHEFELHHGDTLLCYTDGVTEATNKNNELFGNDRLLAALNKNPDANCFEVIENLKKDIDEFVGDAPQFDDITMLCLNFK